MRLQRLTGMEQDKLVEETRELAGQITDYLGILSSNDRLTEVVLEELQAAYDRLAEPRRTEISDAAADQDDEDLIQQEDMVVTVSHRGYIKRVALSDYRTQRRGGKGRTGMKTRDEDFVSQVFITNTHTPILFFTSTGMVFQMKCYKLPQGTPQTQGKAMVNLLPIEPEDTIQTVMPMPDDTQSWDQLNILFATSGGSIRRNKLSDFTNIRSNGKIAMKLGEKEQLVGVLPCAEEDNVLLATRQGKAIRFAASEVRVFQSRDSTGVRGIRLKDKDRVVSMCVIADPDSEFVLSVTQNGYGKRSAVTDYRKTGRGGQGVGNIETSDRNGPVVASFTVLDTDQLMLVTDAGKIIRIRVQGGEGDSIRIAGRRTQGVRLFEIDQEEKVVSVGLIRDAVEEGGEEEGDAEGGAETGAETGEYPGEPAAEGPEENPEETPEETPEENPEEASDETSQDGEKA